MATVKQLRNTIEIIRSGKKPIKEKIFWPNLYEKYEFQGKEYSFKEICEILDDYKNIDGVPIIIWHEEKTYPELDKMMEDGILK